MANKDRSKKEIILIDCITATISALAIEVIYPPFLPIAILLKLSSFLGVGFVVWTFSKYDKVFRNLNLYKGQAIPILKYKTKTNYSTIYHFTLPAGLCLTDFKDNEEAIQNFVGKDIRIEYTFKEIIIEEYDEKMKLIYPYIPTEVNGYVPIIIGYDRKGKLITCDLGCGEPHMLIAGQTGGGKSTAIRCILVNLILNSDVKLHLIDLKNGVELRSFADSSKVISFSRNINQASIVLSQLDNEVDSRYDLFYKEHVRDIIEYNKKHKNNKMDYQLLVCDEFADLQGDKNLIAILDNLGRKARACGIHMILSTQRPDAKVLNGSIKSNIPTILGLKTANSTNSHIIIDDTGLEKLRGNGHGLFKHNGKLDEIQVPYVSAEQIEPLIKHTFIDKSNYNSNSSNEKVKAENFDDCINYDKQFNSQSAKQSVKQDTNIIDSTCEEVEFNQSDIPIFSCDTNTKSPSLDNKLMSCGKSNCTSVVCICKSQKYNYNNHINNNTINKNGVIYNVEKINKQIIPPTTHTVKENDIIVNYTPPIQLIETINCNNTINNKSNFVEVEYL